MTMKTVNRWWCKSFIYLVGSVLVWGLSTGIVQAVENHNSSRSNKCGACGSRMDIVYPGEDSSGGSISATTIKKIQDELDKTPPNQVNEKRVSDLLKKNGVIETVVKKIIVEPGKGGQYRILLLQEPGNEAVARKVSIKEEGVK